MNGIEKSNNQLQSLIGHCETNRVDVHGDKIAVTHQDNEGNITLTKDTKLNKN